MPVEIVDIDVEGLRSGTERPRARHALARPGGPEHDDVRTKLQLRMPDDPPGLRSREQFDEAEGRAERSHRDASVVVSEDGKDRLHTSPRGPTISSPTGELSEPAAMRE